MATPVDDTPTTLVLLISRSDLFNLWNEVSLLDNSLQIWQHQHPVVTFTNPPYLNLQAAQQLLPTLANYRRLVLCVSLLELSHHQCIDIRDGLTTLLDTASEHRSILFHVEYESDNPEHDDVIELATDQYYRRHHIIAISHSNTRSGADNLVLNEGDDCLDPLARLVAQEMREDDEDDEN